MSAGRSREEIRSRIKKHIDDLLIPGCGCEGDTGEPSYFKFTHKTIEDGCGGCEEKMIDWIADEILLALADERRKAVEECCRAECPWCVDQLPTGITGQWIHKLKGLGEPQIVCFANKIRSLPASGTDRGKPQECGHEFVEDKVCSAMLICKLCGVLAAPKRTFPMTTDKLVEPEESGDTKGEANG